MLNIGASANQDLQRIAKRLEAIERKLGIPYMSNAKNLDLQELANRVARIEKEQGTPYLGAGEQDLAEITKRVVAAEKELGMPHLTKNKNLQSGRINVL